jgi:shikimate kinase
MKIILIGYRCTGKTSVGREISKRLRIPFYDTDGLVQGSIGKTIREMVDEEGWDAFRARERAIIEQLPSLADAVIAAGGGAITDAENRNVLKHAGLCVWLTADVKTILDRMRTDPASGNKRPPLSNDGLEQETTTILEARKPLYEALADRIVDTSGKSIDAIVDEICALLVRRPIDGQRSRMT